MTVDEAYEIIHRMNGGAQRNPSDLQQEAKWYIYEKVIMPAYKGKEIPPHLEPDFMEGWH